MIQKTIEAKLCLHRTSMLRATYQQGTSNDSIFLPRSSHSVRAIAIVGGKATSRAEGRAAPLARVSYASQTRVAAIFEGSCSNSQHFRTSENEKREVDNVEGAGRLRKASRKGAELQVFFFPFGAAASGLTSFIAMSTTAPLAIPPRKFTPASLASITEEDTFHVTFEDSTKQVVSKFERFHAPELLKAKPAIGFLCCNNPITARLQQGPTYVEHAIFALELKYSNTKFAHSSLFPCLILAVALSLCAWLPRYETPTRLLDPSILLIHLLTFPNVQFARF